MRKVIVTIRSWPNGYTKPSVVEQKSGIFHQWGQCYDEFETGPGNYTVGIVELNTGAVITPHASDITFVHPLELT